MPGKLINLRLGKKLLEEIDSIVQSETYDNRTEFIRESLRKAVHDRKRFTEPEISVESSDESITEPEIEPRQMGKHSIS